MNKLDKSSKALMTCDLTNSIISLFGETFLVAYFLQVSNENIVQVSIYYIIIYTLLGIGSLVLGNLMKSMPSKRINIYRVGIIVKSIFILLIVLFKENINQYFMIFAIFYGIAEALYWSAHDVMNIEIVDNTNRKQYMTTKRILGKLINIVFPIILGTSIELTSFINIAIYIFILTLIQIIISFNVDSNKFVTEGSKDKYSLKNYINNLSQEQKTKLNKIYKLAFIYGIMMDTIRVLVVIITIMTFKTSLNLGILTTMFAICSIISLYMFNKLYQKKYAKMVLSLCSILIVLGVMGLILNISKSTLILYNFIYSITIYILEVMFKIKADDTVKEYCIQNWIVEYHTFIEGFMDIGRITGFLLMLIIGLLNNIIYFKLLLLIVTICIPIYSIIMYKVENN
ncbi:MAG: MFS transporter [Clostridia bacterium]|nr:MFS transporter [Clostridia bacterium]